MEITVTISEKSGRIIKEKADEKDMGLADFASDLLEDKVKEKFPDREVPEGPHPLLKMAGMFSSGKTDTSVRYKEILLEDVKMPGGFGGD
jgi:hypothetical protein